MKISIYCSIVLLVATLLFSCHSKMDSPCHTGQSEDEEMDSVFGISHTEDSISRTYLAEAIQCIINDDAKGFASHCQYPIIREKPLHKIEDSATMVKYFNTLFDDSIKRKLKGSSIKNWWYSGSHGYCYGRGSDRWYFWGAPCKEGITAINYDSKKEQALRLEMIKKDIACLHPSLRGNWILEHCFKCPNGYIVRIDAPREIMAKFESEIGKTFRMAIFFKGTSVKGKPDIVMYGTRETTGSAGNQLYTFKNKKLCAEFQYNYAVGGEMFPEEFTLKGRINYNTHKLTFFYWDDISK